MLGLLAGVRLRHIVGSESLRPDTDRKLDLRMETRNKYMYIHISLYTFQHYSYKIDKPCPQYPIPQTRGLGISI